MSIRNLIGEIAQEWPGYKRLGKTDKNEPAYDFVVNKFPEELKRVSQNTDYLLFQGSTGAGFITFAPWIATFDTRTTTSATSGYYVVYLFSIDFKRLYLELGFGLTQFTEHFKPRAKAYEKIRSAAKVLQQFHEDKLRLLFEPVLYENISLGPIDLAAQSNHELHLGYQQSPIYSVEYLLSDLPTEDKLAEDYKAFLSLYEAIVLDPSSPSMEQLFERTVVPKKTNSTSPVTDFVPHPPKKKGKGSSSASSKRRYSKVSLKVGNAGEDAVLKSEKHKLREAGLDDLVEQVVHEAAEGNTPGWDITSFNESGEKIFIEVKSTTGKTIKSVDITENEWKAASNPAHRENYYLYLVTEALDTDSPPIQILRNPWDRVNNGELGIRPTVHELSLHLLKTED